MKKTVRIDDLLKLDLMAVPVSFVAADSGLNSTRWFHLDTGPLWTSWSGERVRYEAVLIYRDDKRMLLNVLGNVDSVLEKVLES